MFCFFLAFQVFVSFGLFLKFADDWDKTEETVFYDKKEKSLDSEPSTKLSNVNKDSFAAFASTMFALAE